MAVRVGTAIRRYSGVVSSAYNCYAEGGRLKLVDSNRLRGRHLVIVMPDKEHLGVASFFLHGR